MPKPPKILSVFSLVMINVIAVDSLRTLPLTAKLGMHLVTFYLLAAFIFFIPVALVAAELATAYPSTGGIYVWVREAFGKRTAFLTIWLQWIYNIVWYPTIMAFIAATLSYLFAPELANNKYYLLVVVIGLFWLFTILNCFGMKVSSLVSIIGATIGTLVPMIGISVLGILWLIHGNPIETSYPKSWLPDFSSLGNLSLFSAVLFGLLGIEMSAVHAEEVKNPQRDYPRALFFSTIIIFSTLVMGSLAIIIVVPDNKLSVVSGFIDAYAIFYQAYHMPWMTSLTALLIVIGGLCGVSTWITGPTKGLLISARDGSIPAIFAKVNKHSAPVNILIAQAIIFTLMSSVLGMFESVNAAYWILSVLCNQLALLVYVFMFAAAIKLRYSKPDQRGAYRIPGGKPGIWLIAGVGLICCSATILLGFVPPTQIPIENTIFFEAFLLGGFILFILLPWFFIKTREKTHE